MATPIVTEATRERNLEEARWAAVEIRYHARRLLAAVLFLSRLIIGGRA